MNRGDHPALLREVEELLHAVPMRIGEVELQVLGQVPHGQVDRPAVGGPELGRDFRQVLLALLARLGEDPADRGAHTAKTKGRPVISYHIAPRSIW